MTVTLSIFGQSLPKIVVINGDTNVLISPEQLRFANRQIATVDYLDKKTISLKNTIDAYSNNLTLQIQFTFELQKQNKALKAKANTYKALLKEEREKARDERKQARKRKTRAVITSFGVGVIAGIILTILI